MANLDLAKIKKLYYGKKRSAREVGKILGVSQDVIYDFMVKMKLPRRDLSENNRIIFEKKSPSFHCKKNLTSDEQKLKIAAVMLYWAEGGLRENEDRIDFANSNPEMIRIFMLFLRRICGIDEKRLRVYLYCYANQNINRIFNFWEELTRIPVSQFSKPYIRTDYQMKHKRVMKYGLIHIRYSDKKLVNLIKEWIDEYTKEFRVGTEAVNRAGL